MQNETILPTFNNLQMEAVWVHSNEAQIYDRNGCKVQVSIKYPIAMLYEVFFSARQTLR